MKNSKSKLNDLILVCPFEIKVNLSQKITDGYYCSLCHGVNLINEQEFSKCYITIEILLPSYFQVYLSWPTVGLFLIRLHKMKLI